MALQQPDCQVSLVYFILQAACRFKLQSVRHAAVRWLRQNNRQPTGELLFRLKLAELEEACSKGDEWTKSIDRIIDLLDFITPKDPEQTSFNSPWFYVRNLLIVSAAVRGYDDTICLESCNKHLLRIPYSKPGSADYIKKQEYLSKVAKELASYNGATDKTVMKKNYPLILQYFKKNAKTPLGELKQFLDKFRSTLDPNFCFLESAAESIPNLQDPNADIELQSDVQKVGLKLLLEQFKDVESSLQESMQPAQVPPRSGALDHAEDDGKDLGRAGPPSWTRAGKQSGKQRPHRELSSRKQSGSESESGQLPRKSRKRSFEPTQSRRLSRDRYRENSKNVPRKSSGAGERLEQFQKRRRSVHRAAEKIPDARERAIETARRIQEALEQGVYERWSDNEDQGYGSTNAGGSSAEESRSPFRGLTQAARGQIPGSAGSYKNPPPGTGSGLGRGQSGRRSVGQWQQYEMEELRAGVAEFGVGQWAKILKSGRFLPGRTSVDLKDKYRNMVRRNLFQ